MISGFNIPDAKAAIDEGCILVDGTYKADLYVEALKFWLPNISYKGPVPDLDSNRFKTLPVEPGNGYQDQNWPGVHKALCELADSLGTVDSTGILVLKTYHPDETVKAMVTAFQTLGHTKIVAVKVPALASYMPQG
jgi:hypothetical protein